MSETVAGKMYLTAKKVNDLNANGKVKAFSSNEKGYARIFVVKPGCAIWMHHTKDDRLTVSLMITEAMSSRFPVTEHAAIKKFEIFAGERLRLEEFEHSINKWDKRLKRYVEVTSSSYDEIATLVDQVLTTFSDMGR
jgi:hypothetical protein